MDYPDLSNLLISAINLHVRPLNMEFMVILGEKNHKQIDLLHMFRQTGKNLADAPQYFKQKIYL